MNKSIQDFSRPLVPDLPAAGRRGSTTYVPVGVGRLFQTCLLQAGRNDGGQGFKAIRLTGCVYRFIVKAGLMAPAIDFEAG